MRQDWIFLIALMFAGALSFTSFAAPTDAPAFPEAEGYGSNTPGGRGGTVFCVTTLEDYRSSEDPIAGSLRAAVEAEGPRIVVFRVSGTIALKGTLVVREPYITVAGQTAPGGGICLKDHHLRVITHDVVIRYLRVRPGDALARQFWRKGRGFSPDGVSVESGAQNVLLDHCSFSWGIDEVLDVTSHGTGNVTVQWCIVSEALLTRCPGAGSGYGTLLSCSGGLTCHHNLFAHHRTRTPGAGCADDGSIIDWRNNVVYHAKGYTGREPLRLNFIGNYIKRSSHDVLNISMPPLQVYADDNVLEGAGARNADSWNLFKHPGASDDGWESRARIAVSKSDDAWTAEMAIPFETFSEKPHLGGTWRFNAARTDLTELGHIGSTWAPIVCGEFLQPGVFQPLAFRSEFPQAGRSVSFLGRDAADEATLTCVRTQKAPDLNGRLNDGAWKNAARATGFLLVGVYPKGLRAAPNQSEAFLCHDAEHLYVGVRCELSPEFPPEVHVRKDGGPVWEDECVELFFDPHPAVPDDYYQVIVNPLGALFDTHHVPREIPESVRAETPFAVPRVATDSASEAYDKVLASAGATLPQRDEVDERIVRQVREGSGGLIATQDDVGGWPNLSSDGPPADSDRDGMPDAWELKHGMDPNDAADAAEDSDGDVYTNIEEYLNGTRP